MTYASGQRYSRVIRCGSCKARSRGSLASMLECAPTSASWCCCSCSAVSRSGAREGQHRGNGREVPLPRCFLGRFLGSKTNSQASVFSALSRRVLGPLCVDEACARVCREVAAAACGEIRALGASNAHRDTNGTLTRPRFFKPLVALRFLQPISG